MREFETGATRDTDEGKLDYEGFLSPLVLERYAQYMHENRVQADGNLRDSDNWQKGIPLSAYMKSMIRHVMEVWSLWRKKWLTVGEKRNRDAALEVALSAVLFNVMGMLHELVKARRTPNTFQYVDGAGQLHTIPPKTEAIKVEEKKS